MAFTRLFFLTTLLSAVASTAYADACSAIRTDVEKDVISRLGEARVQGDFEWCWAYTSADLITWKEGLKPSERVSPIDLALTVFRNNPDVPLSDIMKTGGNPANPIPFVLSKGFCREKHLQSDNYFDLAASMKRLMDLQEKNLIISAENEELLCNDVRTFFGHLSGLNDWNQALAIYAQKDVGEFLYDWTEKSCAGKRVHLRRTKGANTYYPHAPNSSEAEARKKIDRELESGGIVGVNYDLQKFLTFGNKPYFHASSIVGRRKNPKTGLCEYLVRNSYGGKCSIYPDKYDCIMGHVWLPADDLLKQSNYLTTYE